MRPTTEQPEVRRGRALKWTLRVLSIVVAVLLGLVVTEWVFHRRAEGAFPHLNVYAADSELGVRLVPGRSQRLSFGGNPVTTVTINPEGFRGAPWGEPAKEEVLVVGDSQVFGLGVEAEEAFPAVLAETLRRPVLNAGVPTYGPSEYLGVMRRLLPERRPKTVILVVNFANDLFEAARSNVDRHAVWDGWAVRKETAPLATTAFPGRAWLYRESHAFFALRRVIYEARHPRLEDATLPSEGDWKDIVGRRDATSEERRRRREEFERLAELRRDEVLYAEQRALQAELELEKRYYEELKTTNFDLRAARANPGDITAVGPGEAGSPLAGTVKQIRAAIAFRNRLEAELKALAEKTDAETKDRIVASLEGRDRTRREAIALKAAAPAVLRSSSPLAMAVEEAKKLCDEHGAELVVVTLPIDVMVSEEEWKKYPSQTPVDTAGTEVLLTDLVEHARALGARALDPTAALRAAQPGAFLNADLHMTPKGHAALAAALAETLATAAPPVSTTFTLPEGRSRVPRPADWLRRKEAQVFGSDAAGCETKIYDEWLRVRCKQKRLGPRPLGVRVVSGGGADALTMTWGDTMTLVAARLRGTDLVADFFWEGERRRLTAPWPAGETIGDDMKLDVAREPAEPPAPQDPEASRALCECRTKLDPKATCDSLLAVAHAPCVTTYAGDCRRMLSCAEGDHAYRPTCPPGQTHAGSSQHCFPRCEGLRCSVGTCVRWGSAEVCVP